MTTNAIIETIKNGETRVNALTHTFSLGKPAEIKDELMILVAKGILESYDDGRRVRLV